MWVILYHYQNGRQFAANLGLTPREHSSGGKHNLGAITKRGNRYLRSLLVQGAWSIIKHAKKKTDRLSRWALAVIERRGKHKAALAVAKQTGSYFLGRVVSQNKLSARLDDVLKHKINN